MEDANNKVQIKLEDDVDALRAEVIRLHNLVIATAVVLNQANQSVLALALLKVLNQEQQDA